MSSNRVSKVAIVGATGSVGKYFVESLLKTGKHTVTALTRSAKGAKVPSEVKVAEVDYDKQESIVEALKGQDCLLITLAISAPPDTHSKLVQAAGKAGVPLVFPNVWGFDSFNDTLLSEAMPGRNVDKMVQEVAEVGSSWVAMVCGFWYEWSLALGDSWYGIDIDNKKVTFFDEGETKINTSTWEQCGRAIAAFLSLPVEGESPCISDYKNKPIYIDSFSASQRDMLDSLNRVQGTTDADWTITKEPSKQRYDNGMKEVKEGNGFAFVKVMYTRVFFPNGGGEFSSTKGTLNQTLGLPKENIDDATKRAIDMSKAGFNAHSR